MNMPFVLDRTSIVPMHKQLRDQIIYAIESGRLSGGQRMPSSRALAKDLRISRIVVVQCYESLTAMGYFTATTGSGSYVRREYLNDTVRSEAHSKDVTFDQKDEVAPMDANTPSSQFATALRECTYIDTGSVDLCELNYGAAPPQYLPTKIWRKILLNLLMKETKGIEYDSHPLGSLELRKSICNYVRRSRNVNCSPLQIAVFSSSQQSLAVLTRLILDNGDRIAVENPGFGHARKLVACTGAKMVPIDIDDEGMRIDQLRQMQTPPKVVYITPSHHDPSGITMSLQRRKDILDWAQEVDALIIEDDYDSEYRYGGHPLPSMQSLDSNGRVIYLANFWKTLFPLVTMGYLILPHRLIDSVSQAKACSDRTMPILEQRALAKIIASGALERHILKTKQAYTAQRQELIFSLTRNFARQLRLAKESAGMHLLFSLDSDLPEETILKLAHEAGISLLSTRSYYFHNPRKREFLVSFANLTRGEIGTKVFMFAASVKQAEQESIGDLIAAKVQGAQLAIFPQMSGLDFSAINAQIFQ